MGAGVLGAAALAALAMQDDGAAPAPVVPPPAVDSAALDSAALARAAGARLDSLRRDSAARAARAMDTASPPPLVQPLPPRETPPVTEPDEDAVYSLGDLTNPPELQNRRDVQRALERNYPPMLRDGQVGGEVQLRFIVGRDGRVEEESIQVLQASNPAFADAARRVAERMRFRAGKIRDDEVRTYVDIPILFQPGQ
jgi:TonB family protein